MKFDAYKQKLRIDACYRHPDASCIIMAEPVSKASAVENSWVEKATMPSPNSGYEAAVVNGIIYNIGASSNYVPSIDAWNVSSTN
jgi:hypothetical protein